MSLKLRSENRMRPSKHFLCGSQQPFNKISSVASQIFGEKLLTLFSLAYRLSKHNDYIF